MSFRLPRLDILLLSCVLALGWLLLLAADLKEGFSGLYVGQVVTSIVEQTRASPVTMGRLYAFAGKVLLLHLAFGLVVWGIACLTLAVVGRWTRYRWLVVIGWFVALTFLLGLANAVNYPWSRTGQWSRAIGDFFALSLPLLPIVASAIVAVLAVLVAVWIWQRGWQKQAIRVLVWSVVAMTCFATLQHLRRGDGSVAHRVVSGAPDIILIGVDSLRPSLVGDAAGLGYAPSLSSFAQGGHRFSDVTTPLARTFPAWMALLTGLRPAHTGIRENLLPRASISVTTLAQILAARGYQTVYATDEVRFSNLDSSYGFEKVLTPRIGASDFLLGAANDLPLTNLFANTILGSWLFPETYANRAAAVTYDPGSFVDRLRRGIRPDSRPLLLAMHLTLPHWPYRWRANDDAVFSNTADSAYAYLAAVVEVDKQFAAVQKLLQDKGLMENTVVIVFSDHGEGLNLPADYLTRSGAEGAAVDGLPMWTSGHGTTVLSPPQFQVFLAARAYGVSGYEAPAAIHADALAIEDVAPTVLEMAGVPTNPALQMDGQSFARILAGVSGEDRAPLRVRFTESALSPPALQTGAVEESALFEQAGGLFQVNPQSGWVEMKTDQWPELLASRERAAIGPTQLLAALPASQPGFSSYLLLPRSGGVPRRLHGPPGEELGAEAQALWNALSAEYEGELGPPAP